jgi:hypothetical protein
MGDGEEAYCIQPGVSLHTGNQLKANASDTWDALSSNQQNALKLALTYGRPGNSKKLSVLPVNSMLRHRRLYGDREGLPQFDGKL